MQLVRCVPPIIHYISYHMNVLAQKNDKVTRTTKHIERDSKDTDATNSCPRKVQIKRLHISQLPLVNPLTYLLY